MSVPLNFPAERASPMWHSLPGKPAHYTRQRIASYAKNPLICAMHPPPMSVKEAAKRLASRPEFSIEERELSFFERVPLLHRLDNFWSPQEEHIRAFAGIYGQWVASYDKRSPFTAQGQRILHHHAHASDAGSISLLLGSSGMGKTTLAHLICLAVADQFIQHSIFEGRPFPELQVSYLHRNVPDSCTSKRLAGDAGAFLDGALGVSQYARRFEQLGSVTACSNALSNILLGLHGGLFVLDDVQNLRLVGVGAGNVLAMLKNLRDQSGFPIVLVATRKVLKIFEGDLDLLRRITQCGKYEIKRPLNGKNKDWQTFCRRTWQFQWIRKPIPHTPQIGELLYELSAGIYGVALSLFKSAQATAMYSGNETVDDLCLRETFDAYFSLLKEPIKCLLSADPRLQTRYEDMFESVWPKVQQKVAASFPFESDPAEKRERDESGKKKVSAKRTRRGDISQAAEGAVRAKVASTKDIGDTFH